MAQPSYMKLQDYSKKLNIDGVEFIDLKLFPDEGGDFTELGRIQKSGSLNYFDDFKVKQINYSVMQPNTVKAFHFHEKQDDVWFVPPSSRLLVGLKDLRSGSPTRYLVMRFVMGGHKNQLLRIPKGVMHGCANLYPKPSTLIYFVDKHFDPKDEFRLDPNLLGRSFWSIKKG